MRAIKCRGAGEVEVLQVLEAQTPVPLEGEVLIKVSSAGVNRPDILQRQGYYPPPPDASEVLGLEVAGIVVEVGDGVASWCVGDRVCALLAGGGYAEYAVADQGLCLPIPQGVSLIDAATLPEVMFTVWHNVFQRGGLQPGQTLLVHGGSSGIGVAAIQLAKAYGCTVVTTAGNEEKCQRCRELGADLAINYREQDFVLAINEFTCGVGVDVILDMVGGEYFAKNVSVAAFDATIVSIAFLNGSKVNLDMMPVMLKRLKLTGSTLRSRTLEFKRKLCGEVLQHCWPLIEHGEYQLVIDSRYELVDVKKAHLRMESGKHIGKIVLQT
ncbi:NADPH2:quinone reductase [Sinobacterium caligoides]|uniref:NADPH2:quinone reductase n=1 Tax=Sinobacterium caligoides TaxID=933926 RepID=A0A3N2DL57_9GAMM|nr:NAD(P)H-quinone oxidoreductase [Sinobacterium caligoides]ROS00085.1 NADPH2:quinone reductase [Sinobacterium caligoides]